MSDDNPKKRAKIEKKENIERIKELVNIRKLSIERYEKYLSQCCRDRLRSMSNGTFVEVEGVKLNDASKIAKIINESEVATADIGLELQKLQYTIIANNAAKEELERKTQAFRKICEIEYHIDEDLDDI